MVWGVCRSNACFLLLHCRCLFNIFERHVEARAREYVPGDISHKKEVGQMCKNMLYQEIEELNKAYVTLEDACNGSKEAQKAVPVTLQAAIDTNKKLEQALQETFDVEPLPPVENPDTYVPPVVAFTDALKETLAQEKSE
uniref:Tubulin-specific chaperone A n=1 Tax=Lotharella globosa TaxID=91324 RepID=A0A7S3YJU6_9EUKA